MSLQAVDVGAETVLVRTYEYYLTGFLPFHLSNSDVKSEVKIVSRIKTVLGSFLGVLVLVLLFERFVVIFRYLF